MAVKVKWLGHAFFQITSQNGKIIYIDPWITENPSCSMKLSDFDRADVILVTHDHFDHVGQTVELSKQTGATVVAPVETAQSLKEQGVPESQIIFGGFGMNIGGTAEIDGIKLTMTQAFHSSATASPAGYIITTEDGKNIYHAGDTGIFESMRLLAEIYPIECALLPIGGVFTMDPIQAAKAVEIMKPKKVIPMHFGSFPILEQSADRFKELVKNKTPDVEVIVLKPGEEITL
ncbi:MAG: metal-dependent hydrolase [Deltaproteobacteria bacterium]|nr:metal-dependent hydrolase [Deltaproteobacteria bacterium]MBW2068258.1 metal-dependent hydrolase [Deltaproteobacteria bacterium]